MSESKDLFKILLFIGVVLFFSTVVTQPWVYVGQPIPPNSTWGQFSSQAGSFPQFQNPFDSRGAVEMFPVASGNITPASVTNNDPGNVTHCTSTSNFYGCVLEPDASVSYVSLNSPHPTLRLNLSDAVGASSASTVLTLFATAQCRATGGSPVNTKVDFNFLRANGSSFEFAQYITCKPGAFQNETLRIDFTAQPRATVADYANGKVDVQGQGPYDLDISYVHIRLEYTDPDCTSGDTLAYIGCLLGQGLRVAFNIVLFIVNGLIFAGQVLFWFASMIGIFFVSFGSLFSMPGTPSYVSALFGIVIIGLIFFVALVFMGKIRGTGNVS